MKDRQRKAMWAKKRFYTGYKVRGKGISTVYNLSEPEAEEWIKRREAGSSFVYKRQKRRLSTLDHRHSSPPSAVRRLQSAKFERCVMDIKRSGQADGYNPWAVCHSSISKKLKGSKTRNVFAHASLNRAKSSSRRRR
jgi:hypothetical protein